MTDLYLLSSGSLALLSTCMVLILMLQTIVAIYGFFRFRPGNAHVFRSYMEALILVWLLLLLYPVSDICFLSLDGLCAPDRSAPARYLVFALLLASNFLVFCQEKRLSTFTVSFAAALQLPVFETILQHRFLPVFFAVMLYWFLHALYFHLLFHYERRHMLSRFSIKEAIDTMNFGILFCHSKGPSDGLILLQNSKMQELMYTLTGHFHYNGKLFYRAITKGELLPDCRISRIGDQTAIILPDGHAWTFELHFLSAKKTEYAMLIAYDNTEYWNATLNYYEKNKKLEIRNRELVQMLENLDTICKTEETIQAKNRVHDVLGQRISLLLRSMREHKEPDEAVLASFAEGLPDELRNASADTSHSLDTLKEIFKGLGVTLTIQGQMPKNFRLSGTFYEIAAEATTNAVRHGYASEISIAIGHPPDLWTLDITDNGIPSKKPVTEGGGLTEMRRKVSCFNGRFTYSLLPSFHIHIEIPEGEI